MLTSNNPFDDGVAKTGAGATTVQAQPPPSFSQIGTATTNATMSPFADKFAHEQALTENVIDYDNNKNSSNNNNNLPSTVASNLRNVSVSTSLYPSNEERQVLAKFRVDVAFKGKQVLRPITYFPIYT